MVLDTTLNPYVFVYFTTDKITRILNFPEFKWEIYF